MVEILGTFMDRSLSEFRQACELRIEQEQAKEKLDRDTDLVALLCDAVRLTREMAEHDDRRSALGRELIAARKKFQRIRAVLDDTTPGAD